MRLSRKLPLAPLHVMHRLATATISIPHLMHVRVSRVMLRLPPHGPEAAELAEGYAEVVASFFLELDTTDLKLLRLVRRLMSDRRAIWRDGRRWADRVRVVIRRSKWSPVSSITYS